MPSVRIQEFDTWQAGYGLAEVRVVLANTDTEADVFTDEGLTAATDNPVTLEERTENGISYGKFAVPLYTGQAYELIVNSIDRTGIVRPALADLDDEDASEATATADGGTEAFTIEHHLARRIDVRDYGDWIAVGEPGASASTNNATLTAALGVAGADSGGYVELPDGTYQVTQFTVPTGTVVRGRGRAATTLLSTVAGDVATIGGARAGFTRITLDGSTLVAASVGIKALNKTEIVLDDVEVKRFESGIYCQGSTRCNWRDLNISNCVNGAKLHGDLASALGGFFRRNTWYGGKVDLCSTVGVELKYIDGNCEHNVISAVNFDLNTGTALKVTGARQTTLRNCIWSDNTVNFAVADGSPVVDENIVQGISFEGGWLSGGTATLTGNLETVLLARMDLTSVTVTLTSPEHNVLVENCVEEDVTIAGDATAWRRHDTPDRSASFLVTTDSTLTKAWAISMAPGDHLYLEAKVHGRRINGSGYKFAHLAIEALRPGALLDYETQTGNFTLGEVVTGATSGATGRIIADTDGGATGQLRLLDIDGEFVDGEIIADGATGSATTNGTLTAEKAYIISPATLAYDGQTVNFTGSTIVTGATSGARAIITADTDAGASGTLDISNVEGVFLDNETINGSGGGAGTAVVNGDQTFTDDLIRPTKETTAGYHVVFVGNDTQVELRVRGATGHTLEWTCDVDVTRS